MHVPQSTCSGQKTISSVSLRLPVFEAGSFVWRRVCLSIQLAHSLLEMSLPHTSRWRCTLQICPADLLWVLGIQTLVPINVCVTTHLVIPRLLGVLLLFYGCILPFFHDSWHSPLCSLLPGLVILLQVVWTTQGRVFHYNFPTLTTAHMSALWLRTQ